MGKEEVEELISQIGLEEVSLHDCMISSVSICNNQLVLEFEDGVWLSAQHPKNSYDGIHKTSSAKLVFTFLFDDFDMVSMRRDHLFKIGRRTLFRTVKEYRMKEIESVIQSKSMFEVLRVFEGFQEIFIMGYSNFSYSTLHVQEVKEFRLFFECVREDRAW